MVLLIGAISAACLLGAYLTYVWLAKRRPERVETPAVPPLKAATLTPPTARPEPAAPLPARTEVPEEPAPERKPAPGSPAGPVAVATHPLHAALARRIQADDLRMPILMKSAGAVLANCSDPNCDAARLSAQIEIDQALTGHILRIANSAAYAPEEPVTSLGLAVMRLGFDTVKEVAVMVTMKERVLRAKGLEKRVSELWRHSAIAAGFAREIAKAVRGIDPGTASICGLLHDMGKPVLLQACLDLQKGRERRAEPAIVDACIDEFHTQVGGTLVRRWGLAEEVAAAVAGHHVHELAEGAPPLVCVTQLADALAKWADEPGCDPSEAPVDHPAVEALGLTRQEVDAVLIQTPRILKAAEAYG